MYFSNHKDSLTMNTKELFVIIHSIFDVIHKNIKSNHDKNNEWQSSVNGNSFRILTYEDIFGKR